MKEIISFIGLCGIIGMGALYWIGFGVLLLVPIFVVGLIASPIILLILIAESKDE